MKPIQLHPFSLLTGSALALLAFVAMGQHVVSTGQTSARSSLVPKPTRASELVVHPRDWFQVDEGVPYTVPPGKIFVIRSVGSSGGSSYDFLIRIDASLVFRQNSGADGQKSRVNVPPLMTVPAGALVEVEEEGTGKGALWGYLVDA